MRKAVNRAVFAISRMQTQKQTTINAEADIVEIVCKDDYVHKHFHNHA